MTSPETLADIEQLYATRGGLRYGEGVTQLEHALQSAVLAEAEGSPPGLIVAALLHDLGHFFEREEDVADGKSDDRHEAVGARLLEAFFRSRVPPRRPACGGQALSLFHGAAIFRRIKPCLAAIPQAAGRPVRQNAS